MYKHISKELLVSRAPVDGAVFSIFFLPADQGIIRLNTISSGFFFRTIEMRPQGDPAQCGYQRKFQGLAPVDLFTAINTIQAKLYRRYIWRNNPQIFWQEVYIARKKCVFYLMLLLTTGFFV